MKVLAIGVGVAIVLLTVILALAERKLGKK